jgi:hypothetical protein
MVCYAKAAGMKLGSAMQRDQPYVEPLKETVLT